MVLNRSPLLALETAAGFKQRALVHNDTAETYGCASNNDPATESVQGVPVGPSTMGGLEVLLQSGIPEAKGSSMPS